MRVAMLGPFRLRAADGRPVEIGGPRVRALLARLALAAGTPVPAETMIADLWGPEQPGGALNALQTLVSRARRADDVPPLRSTSAGYVLDLDPDEVDVHRFDRLAARGSAQLRAGRPDVAAAELREALGLWRGDPLVDLPDPPFVAEHTARLEEARHRAREDRLDAELRLGGHGELVAELDGLCARHPTRERLLVLRMRALAGAGRRLDALAAYTAHRDRLDAELGVPPAAELRELHAELLRDDPESVRAPVAPPRPPRPGRISSFVGREREIAQVREALRRSRLVTLFGPGGAGKTRLAAESIAEIADRPVWFVELASVRDGHDLPSTALTTLGIRETRLLETPQPQGTARVADALAAEPAVLVLDNCEHLIDQAAAFAHELLTRCPDLRVLTTSREPLALTGEELLPVGPLELPADDADPAGSAAVRLFVDRARSARPDFELTERTAPEVVEVCRRLDGIPLAIELAAARLRSMSPAQIAARLDDRFRLLTGGNRTSLPRHRTLRAVVEWSWELLSEQERLLARRMAVFAGGVRAESVAAVCSGPELPAAEVFYVLSSLVEKSLVHVVDTEQGRRYRMLETVRAYCGQRCTAEDDPDRVRTAHLAHFLAVAEEAEPRLHDRDQVEWMERLDADHDNLLAALHWAVESTDADGGLRLAAALSWYWTMAAQDEDAQARLDAVAALTGPASPQARAAVQLARTMGDRGDGWFCRAQEAARAARAADVLDRYRHAGLLEAGVWLIVGEFGEVRRVLERAAAHPDPWVRAAGLFGRAFGAEHGGDALAAEEHVRVAAAAFRELGDRWGQAQTMNSLAGFRSLRGDHAGAIEVLTESLESLRRLRSRTDLASLVLRIGMERVRAGDLDGGRADLEHARSLVQRRQPWLQSWLLTCLAEQTRLAGEHEESHRLLDEIQALPVAPHEQAAALQLQLVHRARLLLDEGLPGEVPVLLGKALSGGFGGRDMPAAAVVAECAARWCVETGQPRLAARLHGLAAALRGLLDEGDPDVREARRRLDLLLAPDQHRQEAEAGAALSREEALAELRALLAP
ncbi:ATP-binding protein [Saccharopolyspora sp. MS10]|uniref:ATP-binding protein n=1 Tax=Saccharopolyspora sp. MS10 TaxID=3385973 RepID=UPI0039A0AA83